MKAWTLSLVVGLIALPVMALRADTITLTDGRVIQGHLNRSGNFYIIEPDQGVSFKVPVTSLAGIELGALATPENEATNAWNVLQYHIDRESTLEAIIDCITVYQTKFPHSPFLTKANAELIQYKQYQSLKFIHFAGKWMAEADAESLTFQADAEVQSALVDERSGNITAARIKAQAALKINPDSVGAKIVLGVLDYRADNLQGAAEYFSAVVSKQPANVIALNDLAITVYHQRQQPRALIQYHQALNIAGTNRLLLDNIYIALTHYTGDHSAVLYRNLSSLFDHADAKMQAQMAKEGLYRLGATWVPRALHDKLSEEFAAFEKQKSAPQAQYDSAELYLNGVQQQLQQVAIQVNSLNTAISTLQVQQSYAYIHGGIDLNYQTLMSGYMAQLAVAQASQAKLQSQAISINTNMRQMRLQAKTLEKSSPEQAFLMHQRMMLPGDLEKVPPPAPLMVAGPPAPANPVK